MTACARGVSFCQVGDVNGDSVPDMLVGDNEAYFTGKEDGAGYLFLLNTDGTAKDVLYVPQQLGAGTWAAPCECTRGNPGKEGTIHGVAIYAHNTTRKHLASTRPPPLLAVSFPQVHRGQRV